MKVLACSLDKEFKKFEKQITLTALTILKILGKKNIYVEIYLASDKIMKFLNKKFRNKNKAADVLSFNEPAEFPHPELVSRGGAKKIKPIGEIYLNISKVKSQKSKVHLLAHGILHLLGYNHKKKNDRIKMEKVEQKLLLKF